MLGLAFAAGDAGGGRFAEQQAHVGGGERDETFLAQHREDVAVQQRPVPHERCRPHLACGHVLDPVTTYLEARGLRQYFARMIGRYDGMYPVYLKPNSHLVLALIGLDAPPWTTTLVGDSVWISKPRDLPK